MTTMNKDWSLRRREDMASIALGVAAVLAPWVLPSTATSSMIALNALLVGLVICALAALDLYVPPHWEEPVEMIAGAWLMSSPAWLGYSGALGTVHVLIGAGVILLAGLELWQDLRGKRA